jgi:hypothetical protein
VYGFNPRAPIDLLPLPQSVQLNSDATSRAAWILKMHELTKSNIEKMDAKYSSYKNKGRKHLTFEPGDLVWLHLRKDRFPELRKSKLMPRADGPFKILEKINDNAYKLELPADFGVSPTFNVADLKPYLGEEGALESRTTPVLEGEDDEDIAPSDTIPITNSTSNSLQGPMTRARTRHLNYEVRSFLMLYTNINEDGMLLKPSDVLLLRNMGSAQFTSNKLWCMQSTRATSSFDTPFTSSQPPLTPTSSSTPSLCSSNKH